MGKAASADIANAKKGAGPSKDEIAIADKANLPEPSTKDTNTSSKLTSSSMKSSTLIKKPMGGKIADRLKAFETVTEAGPPLPPAPPAPPTGPLEDKKKSKTSKSLSKKEKEAEEEKEKPASPKNASKSKAVPGSFPDDEPEIVPDMPVEKKSTRKSKTGSKEKDMPNEEPKLEPAGPPTPPPESKSDPKSSKKERPRVVRDGSTWGSWGASARKDGDEKENKFSKDAKPAESPAKETKGKKPKEFDIKRSKSTKKPSEHQDDKVSSKGSSSDKADSRPPKSRGLSGLFGAAPPMSRSKSVSEKRPGTSGKTSSRRSSVMEGSGLMSPPPDTPSKAAKILGGTPGRLARSKSEKQSKPRGLEDDDDLVMVDNFGSPEKPSRDRKGKSKVYSDPFKAPSAVPMPPIDYDSPSWRKRSTIDSSANARYQQTRADDDIVMVDAGGPSDNLGGLKRTDSSAKKGGLGGMLGGFLSKSRPDNKRRSTAMTDDDGPRGLRREDRKIKRSGKGRSEVDDLDITMSGGVVEEDQEARREARRARRAEKEAIEKAGEEARKARDEERREKRKRQEEEAELKMREEKEARRVARRKARAREDEDRLATEAKDAERAERRRFRKGDRDGLTDGEGLTTEDPARLKKSDRRKSHMHGPAEEDEERRRRREERHRMRAMDTPKTSRRKSAPIVDSYFDSRSKPQIRDEYVPANGPAYQDSKRKKAGWPHSGTDSWVQETSDAPPPPEDAAPGEENNPVADEFADEDARRRLRRTRKHSKVDETDDEKRRRRRSERGAATVRSGEGSQGDGFRSSRKDSGFVDAASRAPSASGGLFSRFKRIAGV
ncbi:hypothetical protein BJ878DRAFT_488618 [Calycina marina]|uniref:Uncharacterized protein n=1 Tax=Calycina marina TaxID=1763456 RepID=A0A9P7Z9Z2_9HELO|nr:hypothetical protein BJ878DRAFT_488618 [Calycina marina]